MAERRPLFIILRHRNMEITLGEHFSKYREFTGKLACLGQISAIIDWDQQTYMPAGAASARAEQAGVLSEVIHSMATSAEAGELLKRAEEENASADPDSHTARALAVGRKNYDRSTRLPAELVAEISRHTASAISIWSEARAKADFSLFAPTLAKTFELTRRTAEYLGYEDHIYDALIDQYEPGATQKSVQATFANLVPHLVKLNAAIAAAQQVDDAAIKGSFPTQAQRDFTLSIASKLGYDLNHGRQDETAHPFCTSFSKYDVRITTRFDEAFLQQGLYATLHEAGHAMYEQGMPDEWQGTPIGGAASLGIHESQSRMWENQVGRSREFAGWIYPFLKEAFPNCAAQTPEDYYRAVNKSEPSFIRVEADEVTYNLHIAIRFELECALLTGELKVEDLPAAWNEKMQSYLGITPADDAEGVLQDVHWAIGLIGYFPTYSIGNLVSAQLWNSAEGAIPDLRSRIAVGDFAPLLAWLNSNVHVHGSRFLPNELVQHATGAPLDPMYYVNYLFTKYSDIYGLTL